MSTTTCPASWNSRSLVSTTVWPRWRSGAVGSSPSFTRSGRPSERRCASASAGRQSTALRARYVAVATASGAGVSIRPNANVSPSRGPIPRAPRTGGEADGRLAASGAQRTAPRLTHVSADHRPHEPRHRHAHAADGQRAGAGERGRAAPAPPGSEPTAARPPADRAASRRAGVWIRKLRVLGVLFGLGILAIVSTIFGMLMAITSDLPQLEVQGGANSVIVDRNGHKLGMLTGNEQRYFVQSDQIAPVMKQAIIAIEDRRFYTNAGVDLRGIGRALWQDVRHQQAVQGGSTITMQFVKNALAAQDDRTLFQKMREAALAYQITRKWSKERILRNYLNTIYFGNGAYGIEAAARMYFRSNHPGCGDDGKPKCAQMLHAGGGRDDRRPGRLAERLRPAPAPLRGRQAARARAPADARAGLHHAAPGVRGTGGVAPDQPRHPAAERGHAVPVLHVVGQAAGRRQARRRPGRRPARVRGRPDRADDARLAAPGRRAERRQPVAAVAGRPARLARRRQERHRRGARDGRRRRLQDQAVQPRDAGPAPAGLLVQAVRARAGADRGRLARLRLELAEDRHLRGADEEGQVQGVLRRQQLRGRVRRRPHPADGDDLLRQLRLRPARRADGHEEDRAARAPDGDPHAGLEQLRHDARRPQAGRHRARHGPRVRDDRAERAASPGAR